MINFKRSICSFLKPTAYPNVSFHTLLPILARTLKPKAVEATPEHAGLVTKIPEGDANAVVTQAAFWPSWGKFFQPNDIILAETGTSAFGMLDVALPPGSTFISQTLYGSIGYAGGALLGALKAAQEAGVKRRTILFIGDGSLYAYYPLNSDCKRADTLESQAAHRPGNLDDAQVRPEAHHRFVTAIPPSRQRLTFIPLKVVLNNDGCSSLVPLPHKSCD